MWRPLVLLNYLYSFPFIPARKKNLRFDKISLENCVKNGRFAV